jgi:hypothetical protein
MVDRGVPLDGGLSGYNTEIMTVDHRNIVGEYHSLHFKDFFCIFQKRVGILYYKRLNISSQLYHGKNMLPSIK